MAKRRTKRRASVRETHVPGRRKSLPVRNGRRKSLPVRGILLTVLGLGLSVAFVLWSTGDLKLSKSAERAPSQNARKLPAHTAVLAEQWLTAVTEDDITTALARAKDLCKSIKMPVLSPAYIAMAEQEGLPAEFLSDPFNRWDYERWKYCCFLSRLSHGLTADPDDVRALFTAVCERISPAEKAGTFAQPPWPYRVWKLGVGVCDRQAWLLCELAYQRVGDAVII